MADVETDFQRCSIGGANFVLLEYTFDKEPVTEENRGRVRWKVSLKGKGEVRGTNHADLSAKVAAVAAALAPSGQNITIFGFGDIAEVSLIGAQCINNGPHIGISLGTYEAPFRRTFNFTVTAETVSGGLTGTAMPGETAPAESYEQSIKYSPTGLRTVSRKGDVNGVAATNYFLQSSLAQAREQFPLPKWVLTHTYSASSTSQGLKVTYTIEAIELAMPLPSADGNTFAVDGDATKRVDRDDQMRKTTVLEIDVAVRGDPMALVDHVRQQYLAGKAIMRETMQFTIIREPRVRMSFTVLEGGDGSTLLNFSQRLSVTKGEDAVYSTKLFPGCEPLLLQNPKGVIQIVQSGSATGAGEFPQVPAPIHDVHMSPPKIDYEDTSRFEKRVTWSYTMRATADQIADMTTLLAQIKRPEIAYSGSYNYEQ